MRQILLALTLTAAMSCEGADTTVLIDNDVCMLTRRELIDYLADVVDLAWDQLGEPDMEPADLVAALANGALMKCGRMPDIERREVE